MRTPREHRVEAERLLRLAEDTDWHIENPQDAQFVAFALAAAQVHATLALPAAGGSTPARRRAGWDT